MCFLVSPTTFFFQTNIFYPDKYLASSLDICAKTHAGRMRSVRYYRPILAKIGMSQQILVELGNTEFNENSFSSFRAVACRQMDRQPDRQIWLS
jgi:hypothetical protein